MQHKFVIIVQSDGDAEAVNAFKNTIAFLRDGAQLVSPTNGSVQQLPSSEPLPLYTFLDPTVF